MICYGHAIEVTHFKLQIFKLPFKPYCWEAYDQDIVCKFVCFKVCHFGCAMYRGMHKLLGGKPFQQNKPKSPVKLWTFLCQSSGCFLFSFLSRLQIDMPLNELPLPWPVSHSLISVLITLYVWSVWSWWSYGHIWLPNASLLLISPAMESSLFVCPSCLPMSWDFPFYCTYVLLPVILFSKQFQTVLRCTFEICF